MTKQTFEKIMKTYHEKLDDLFIAVGQELVWQYEENGWNFDIKINEEIQEYINEVEMLKDLVNKLIEIQKEEEKEIK